MSNDSGTPQTPETRTPVQGMLLDPTATSAPTSPAAADAAPADAAATGADAAPRETPEAYGFAALTPSEARVLGCLLEKQMTTPEYYPLTLNALVAACSQKNNRAPVVEYDDKTVVRALDSLRDKKIVWMVTTSGGRVPKYDQRLGERLFVTQTADLAVLCELLVRGPQTAGELRTRAERMHRFANVEETQALLDALAGRGVPLVVRLPRLPGHKEPRYTHLLSGKPTESAAAASDMPPEAARAAVLADDARLAALEAEVKALQTELAGLKAAFEKLRAQLGA